MPTGVYATTRIHARIEGLVRLHRVRQQAIVNAILKRALDNQAEVDAVIAQIRQEDLCGATSLEASGW